MKIIHTADWHLCESLGRIDRTADLQSRVEIVAGLCEEHAVDVLVIAGDLFSGHAATDAMTEALNHLHETFAPFFARGGTILAVTGNHDRDKYIDMVRAGMRLATIPRPGAGPLLTGRMYLQNGASLATVEIRRERVQFALVPYPTVSRYAEPDDAFRSLDQQNRAFQGRIAEWLKNLPTRPEFNAKLPTVLAAHLHVRGSEVHTLYQLSERDDVVFDTGFLPTTWAYIALGHIHKPQCLAGMPHVRYPGSLDRLDFKERADDKGVILLDVGPKGLRHQPTWLPIPATPMYEVTLTDLEAELPTLPDRYPDRETAIVRVIVNAAATGPGRHEASQILRQTFPRHTEITWVRPETSGDGNARGIRAQADHRTTVRNFLAGQLEGDPDKDAVLALAETFLTEEAAP